MGAHVSKKLWAHECVPALRAKYTPKLLMNEGEIDAVVKKNLVEIRKIVEASWEEAKREKRKKIMIDVTEYIYCDEPVRISLEDEYPEYDIIGNPKYILVPKKYKNGLSLPLRYKYVWDIITSVVDAPHIIHCPGVGDDYLVSNGEFEVYLIQNL
jgi:hypothetical protein